MNSSKRENWLDFTRGICAFCVLLAHNTTQLEIISLYNPYFLMLFFFISGYLFKVKTTKELIKGLLNGLVLPYFILNLILFFIGFDILHAFLDNNYAYISNRLLDILTGKELWFVSCLIIVRVYFILLYLISKYFGCWNKITITLVNIIAIFFIYFVHSHPANKPLFWYVDTAFYSLGYFGLGYVFKNSKFELKITKYNKLVASVFLIIYVLISYYSQLNCNVEFHVYTNEFASPLYFIIMSILGIFIMIYFSRCFENSDNYVTRYIIALGRNSLLLFALNGKTSQLVMYFLSFCVEALPHVVYVFLNCIIQGAIILCFAYFVNKYIPQIVGKKRWIN